MRTLKVNLGEKSYNILIEKGIIKQVGQYVKANKTVVITDNNVNHYYGEQVISTIDGNVKKLVLPAGEETKSLDSLKYVYNFLLDFKITRDDLIIALGGGVIGDLSGFAAATVLRGVRYIQIPTSLLAQVDSSIGGKVAVNSDYGKNLIGAFYQPKLVLIDPDCLATLDKRFFSDGMAEVIKYGCIYDKDLFDIVEAGCIDEKIDEIIERCCNIKRQVVEKDEFDTGERMLLNFGHTIGHAVENHYNYQKYSHGEAVAIGMYNICVLGEKMGITAPGTADRVKQVLIKYNLPFRLDIGMEKLSDAIALDKKSQGENINLILLKDIGSAIRKKDRRTLL
ncbi:MAG: 3-dehydroquinate synthase [Clostridiaceae bacterium]|nr:3-dehydroquinate synthase [Clostridiaceae bacterium]